jgi:hypothetical protein
MNERYKCWVVSWCNEGEVPTVTVFNNKAAADMCLMYNIEKYDHIAMDECPVYGKYLVSFQSEEEGKNEADL